MQSQPSFIGSVSWTGSSLEVEPLDSLAALLSGSEISNSDFFEDME